MRCTWTGTGSANMRYHECKFFMMVHSPICHNNIVKKIDNTSPIASMLPEEVMTKRLTMAKSVTNTIVRNGEGWTEKITSAKSRKYNPNTPPARKMRVEIVG